MEWIHSPIKKLFLYFFLLGLIQFLPSLSFSQTTCNFIWATWTNQGTTNNATATLNANGQTINMNMTANYNFGFTPSIFSYGSFSGFPFPPPNTLVPRTDWAAGPGGQTTMCFSTSVANPVLLLSSIGNPSTPVTLTFSMPYVVLYNGGGCTFTTTTSILGQEGYCIIEFPGTFTCVTINSSTPEYYSNLTWGIRNPLTAGFTFSNVCQGDSMSFSSATSSINLPSIITGYDWNFGDGTTSVVADPTHLYSLPGNYNVRLVVISSNGCNDTLIQSVTVYSNPVVNLGPDVNICQGNAANLNAGNPGSTYLWSTGSGLQQISPTTAGSYSVLVTSVNNCIGRDTIQVNVNPYPVVNLGPDVALCQGQTTTLNAGNPGSSFLWSTGSILQQISTGNSGIVWANVTNGAGCSARDSVLITVSPVPVVNLGPDINICQGSTANMNAGNPFSSFLWNTGATSQSISTTVSGTFSVQVTNANGCVGRDTIRVIVNSNPVVNLGADFAFCQGLTGSLNAGNPGSTFLWSTGAASQQITIGSGGLFWANVTNGSGCSSRDSITITVHPNPVVNLGADVTLCPGDSLPLNAANPGNSVLWSNGSTQQQIVAHPSGTFWVEVTDVNNCRDSDTIQLNLFFVPTGFLGPDDSLCQGQTILLNAGNPGSTYLWSDGSNLQSNTVNSTGMNWVRVTLPNGCIATDTVAITAMPLPIVNLGADITFCDGQSAIIDAGNTGNTFLWSNANNQQQITVSASGIYWVIVTDGYGCSKSDSVNVTAFPNPVVNLGPDQLVCEGQTVTLNAGNTASNIMWSDGSTNSQLTTSVSGTFSVTVIDVNGCIGSDVAVVTIAQPPVVNLGPDFTFCDGQTRTLYAANNGSNYLWSTTSTQQTITLTQGGTFWVLVTDINGCFESDTLSAIQYPNPIVDLGADDIICQGNTIVLNAGNPGSTFLWMDGSGGQQYVVTGGGIVSVLVTDANGCSASDQILFTPRQLELFSLGPDTTICSVSEWRISTTVNGNNFLWSTGEIGSSILVKQSGIYSLVVSQECGTVTDSISIEFEPGSVGPFPPNAFTPNGDGLNDLFRIESVYSAEDFLLQIFDRWGRLVFTTTDPKAFWDGNFNGTQCPEAVYAFTYRARNCSGYTKTIGGTVTLLR